MKNPVRFSFFFSVYFLMAAFWGMEIQGTSDRTAFYHMDMSHSFEGPAAIHLERIVKKFNAISPKIQVILKFSQNKDGCHQISDTKNGNIHPALMWIAVNRQREMAERKEAYIPLNEVITIHTKDFIPAVYKAGVIDQKHFFALPLGLTVPVLFYNKKAFKEAGLNPHKPPVTWEEVEKALIRLKTVGYRGIAITDTPMGLIEHFSALHNLSLSKGKEHSLTEISRRLQKRHFREFLKRLTKWRREEMYIKGSDSDLQDQFVQGKVAILLTEAHHQEMIMEKINKQDHTFKVGVGPYPYSQSVVARPYAMDVQGQSLWVMSDSRISKKEVALFLEYLMSSEVQTAWHEKTAFLPFTKSTYKHLRQSGFYSTHPVHKIACHQTIDRPVASSRRRLSLSDSETMKLNQSLEDMIQGEDPATVLNILEN